MNLTNLNTIYSFLQNLIDYYNIPIMYWFTIILCIFSNKWLLIILYVIGFQINKKINSWLKNYWKQPLPEYSKLSKDEYGMPSGHSQDVLYTSIFVLSFFSSNLIRFIYLFSSLLILFNCLKYHTIMQIIVGSFFGSVIGFFTVKIGKYFLL